ncbi:MAG: metal-dependent hydrolase [Bacteroidota bacterium]
MDSITQITLGAAVGEMVLGKKIGNRAMLWGGIAGTIPDLDVIGNFFMTEVDAIAFHRGITHSIAFAVATAPVFGWLVHKFYKNKIDRNPWYKGSMSGLFGILYLFLLYSTVLKPLFEGGGIGARPVIIIILIGAILGVRSYRYFATNQSDLGEQASWKEWSWLFFWGLLTHTLLDCFTTYGTQLFQPFSDFRVAFCNISVADPTYTIPFLVFILGAAWMKRGSKARSVLLWLGVGISSLYMAFTIYNKSHVNAAFVKTLKEKNLKYSRYMTSPSIFNNILWTGIAESDGYYYYGAYSIFDEEPFMQIDTIRKNDALLEQFGENRDEIEMLKWFTNDYYVVEKNKDGYIVLNDLRFGVVNGMEEIPLENIEKNYVFKFRIKENDNLLSVNEIRERPDDIAGELSKLWNRMMGFEKRPSQVSK